MHDATDIIETRIPARLVAVALGITWVLDGSGFKRAVRRALNKIPSFAFSSGCADAIIAKARSSVLKALQQSPQDITSYYGIFD